MIRTCTAHDLPAIASVINAAAEAYRGVIPRDSFHDPYMSLEALRTEVADGIAFFACEDASRGITGVIGLQDKGDAALVRHAYVVPRMQRLGIGAKLLAHVRGLAAKPVLVGTWASAHWAIAFYRRSGFEVVPDAMRDRLLARYWSVPAAQARASVVLAETGGR